MHERAGDAFGDAEEFDRAGEDFDEGCAGEVGQVNLHAVAEPAGGLLIGGDGGHFREQGARVRETALDLPGVAGEGFEFVKRDGLGEREGASLRAAQRSKVRAASCHGSELVRDGADVASGGNLHLEAGELIGGRGAVEGEKLEAMDEDARWLDVDGLACAGEFVRRDTVDFYPGERLEGVAAFRR